jgi:hypothetical protein
VFSPLSLRKLFINIRETDTILLLIGIITL